MDVSKTIQVAVARADLLICAILRRLPVIAILTAVLLLAVIFVRARIRADPYEIDYDAPGVDITSEGPENDHTRAWYEWKGEDDHDMG